MFLEKHYRDYGAQKAVEKINKDIRKNTDILAFMYSVLTPKQQNASPTHTDRTYSGQKNQISINFKVFLTCKNYVSENNDVKLEINRKICEKCSNI